jgi:hypothetical protein
MAVNLVTGVWVGDLHGVMRRYNEDRVGENWAELAHKDPRILTTAERTKLADLNHRRTELIEVNGQADVHRMLGVAVTLVIVLVNSIIFTYFIGTGRWCKEVVAAYSLDPTLVASSAALKRRTFPWALSGMIAVLVISGLGAAGDPLVGLADGPAWITGHFFAAVAGICLVTWSFYVQWNYVGEHHLVVEQIMQQVTAARQKRGLIDH